MNVYPSSDKKSKGNYVQEYVDENDKYSNQVKTAATNKWEKSELTEKQRTQ